MCIYIYICMNIHIYEYICIYMYTCTFIYIHVCIHIYTNMYISIHVHICIYIYTHMNSRDITQRELAPSPFSPIPSASRYVCEYVNMCLYESASSLLCTCVPSHTCTVCVYVREYVCVSVCMRAFSFSSFSSANTSPCPAYV